MLAINASKLQYQDTDVTYSIPLADIEAVKSAREKYTRNDKGEQEIGYGLQVKTKYTHQWISFETETLLEAQTIHDAIVVAMGIV